MTSRLPLQSSLRLDVIDIVGEPGAEKHVAAAFEIEKAGITLADLDGPIEVDIRLEGILEGVVAVGKIGAPITVRCRGCLEERREFVEVMVHELFSTDPGVEGDEEVYPVFETEIDIEQMLRDAAVLALPDSPLFCEDMATCPNFEAILAAGNVERDTETRDPRWAALDDLFPDDASEADADAVAETPEPTSEDKTARPNGRQS